MLAAGKKAAGKKAAGKMAGVGAGRLGAEAAELRFHVNMFKKYLHLELDKLGEDADYWDCVVLEHELFSGKFAPISPPPVLCFLFVRSARWSQARTRMTSRKCSPGRLRKEPNPVMKMKHPPPPVSLSPLITARPSH